MKNKVLIVIANYYKDISRQLLKSAQNELKNFGLHCDGYWYQKSEDFDTFKNTECPVCSSDYTSWPNSECSFV